MAVQVTHDALRAMAALAGVSVPEARLDALVREMEWLISTLRTLDEVDAEGLEPVTIAVVEG
jgi:hypothetical protein